MAGPRVVVVPMLRDNYGYLLVCSEAKVCAVVDPVEPDKILAAAKAEGVKITHILTTHSHWDHAGGNKALVAKLGKSGQSVAVLGGANDGIPAVTQTVKENDIFKVGSSLRVRVLDTPCHTPGHICFIAEKMDSQGLEVKGVPSAVFTGDTLFVGGCGNFNAGTPQQMSTNFAKLGALAKDTLVYCGHEYTLRNLAYATSVEPENEALQKRVQWAEARRKEGRPTVPSTIGDEWQTNPFLRTLSVKSVQNYAKTTVPWKAMLYVRKDKDAWGRRN